MRWTIRISLVLIVLVAAGYLALEYQRPVAVVKPVKRGVAVDAPNGTVTVTALMSRVEAEVDGRILKSNLKLGAEVRVGDVLVEIDSASLELEIERLTNDLAAAKRRMEIGSPTEQNLTAAQAAAKLAEADFNAGRISANDLEAAKRAATSAKQVAELERVRLAQDVDSLANQLAMSEHRLSRMKIVAGVDGTVVAVFAHVTDRVSPGTVLAHINSRERLVEMQVREEQIAKLEPGQAARVQFQPYPTDRFDGVIEQILPPLDVASQRYRVLLKVDIEPERLIHGMTGEAFVVIARHEDALLVPRSSVVDRKVFVIEGSTAVLRPVEVGFTSIHEVEILSGLREGERIVVENLDDLRSGTRVRVREKVEPKS